MHRVGVGLFGLEIMQGYYLDRHDEISKGKAEVGLSLARDVQNDNILFLVESMESGAGLCAPSTISSYLQGAASVVGCQEVDLRQNFSSAKN